LSLVNNTYNDSFDLYYGLFMYNKNATAELSRLELAFSQVKAELFDRLHTLIRDDIFDEKTTAIGLVSGNGKVVTNGTVGMEQQTAPSVSSVDRTFKDRLIDQVNQGGSLGGSIDSSGEKKEEKKEEGSPTSR
jgi:arogenate dehydrogenase (NADP+)